MTDKPLAEQTVDRLIDLQTIVQQNQLLLMTVWMFLTEQPAYNAARFAAIFEEFRDNPSAMAKRLESSTEGLRNFLRAFEGRPH